MTSVDQAVRLVRQAVIQDSKQNYPEAARCYREAIVTFHELKKSRSSSKRLQELLATKLIQYEERLKILDEHLLSKTDLTKFFKDLETCHFDDCRSSISSDSKQLYKNPLLVKALDLIRRGRKEDEKRNFTVALACYESGLASLLDVLNRGILTERQTESARVKCLLYHDRAEVIRGHLERGGKISGRIYQSQEDSIDSDCDSPVPRTETEEMLQMDEVHSCSSRLGSTQSLNQSFDTRHISMHSLHAPLGRRDQTSRSSSTNSLNKTHEIIEGPLYSQRMKSKPSVHSLYPMCEIKQSASVLSIKSGFNERNVSTPCVPLASMTKELSLSDLSIHSNRSAGNLSSNSRKMSRSTMSNMEKIMVLEESTDDTFDPELMGLKDSCDDAKSEGSDSGYSDPSPDGTIRDSKSPGSDDTTDRKSPFSDISEEIGEFPDKLSSEVIPNIIVVNESKQLCENSPSLRRQYGRQNSRFQNPNKDILISQMSQDNLAVFDQDYVDAPAKAEPRVSTPKNEVTFAAVPEVYTRRSSGHREHIPSRATARDPRGEHEDMNKGCYYLMAALDFCWCL
eukprot:GFUD01006221.1.p1 GENE.GFUD01006221.1~~GFUD01006221.1.p1  ORF type:complete len:567 (+),score=63.10 GFUD01006221.1:580-2280(+)